MEKHAKQNSQFIAILAGCTFLLASLLFLSLRSLAKGDSLPLPEQEEVVSRLPMRLTIPRIGVDTALESVGLTPEGAVDVPKEPLNAAWFDLGPRPGEAGSAVIAGHYGWKDGLPAVFDDVHTLRKGDTIYVEDEKGVKTAFVVRELRTYGEHEDASVVFGSSDGEAHLNLVTCEGLWNKVSKSYSKRLVVFTDKDTRALF